VGRPQGVFVRLAEAGAIASPVLDAGCGTGEHTLMLAELGLEVVGVDIAPTAIARARQKAAERGLSATFLVADVLALDRLGRRFRTVIDSGVFHVFRTEEEVAGYVASLHGVLEPDAVLHLMCFSDEQPGTEGPRRVSQGDLRAAFADGWRIESIEPASFEVNTPGGAARAWLARILRLPDRD
jgi:cyclopropane fatty-acyl-phospholipid synthase-like methyltransferase